MSLTERAAAAWQDHKVAEAAREAAKEAEWAAADLAERRTAAGLITEWFDRHLGAAITVDADQLQWAGRRRIADVTVDGFDFQVAVRPGHDDPWLEVKYGGNIVYPAPGKTALVRLGEILDQASVDTRP